MIPALVIRPFAAGDTDAVIELRNRAFEELSGDAYNPAQMAALRENRVQKDYAEELIRNHIMLAFDNSLGLVAMGGWIAMPDDVTIGRIRKLAVHPAAARRGIGRHMVEDAERRARDSGCTRFIVRSSSECRAVLRKPGLSDYRPRHRADRSRHRYPDDDDGEGA